MSTNWKDTVPQEAQEYLREWKAQNRGADPREDEPAWDCEKCHDNGSLPNGDTCPDCCPHDEHDHGICLDCGRDIMDDIVAAAEMRCDAMEDR